MSHDCFQLYDGGHSHDCFQLYDGGHFGASLFSFRAGGGSAMARIGSPPLRAQTGITCFGARLPFLLHLLHEIECGFIGSLDPLTFTV